MASDADFLVFSTANCPVFVISLVTCHLTHFLEHQTDQYMTFVNKNSMSSYFSTEDKLSAEVCDAVLHVSDIAAADFFVHKTCFNQRVCYCGETFDSGCKFFRKSMITSVTWMKRKKATYWKCHAVQLVSLTTWQRYLLIRYRDRNSVTRFTN